MKIKSQHDSIFETWLLLEKIRALLDHPITEKKSSHILSKLEEIQRNCTDENILNATIFLYGKVASSYNKHLAKKISSIEKIKNPVLKKNKVSALKKTNGISRENFQKLSNIGKNLSSTPLKIEQVPIEEVEALFDLATLIYDDKTTEAKDFFCQLTPTTAIALLKHFSIIKKPFLENKLVTLQVIFSTAYQLSGKSFNRFLSQKEIEEFFIEKKQVIEKETKNKQFSLRHFSNMA